MLAVIFLSVWLGVVAAMNGRGRWYLLAAVVLVVILGFAGAGAAVWWTLWFTPIGAIGLGYAAGWTESRRVNAVALSVVVINLVGYCFLGLGDYDPPTLDGGMKFAAIVFGFYAMPALLGRLLRDADRWTQRRVASGALEQSVVSRTLRGPAEEPLEERPRARAVPPPRKG